MSAAARVTRAPTAATPAAAPTRARAAPRVAVTRPWTLAGAPLVGGAVLHRAATSEAPATSTLRVSDPGDAAEREAESVAQRIVQMPDRARPVAPGVARSTAALQRASTGSGTPSGASLASELQGELAGGAPLAPSARAYMEPRFGASFANVRVHAGERAARLALALGARAFTYGRHVFFGRGAYEPDSAAGRHLLAHELVHVVQQGEAVAGEDAGISQRAPASVQRLGIRDTIANKANAIPGFRMITIVLGFNPINMARVDRSAANVLRAMLEFAGLGLLVQALDGHGVFEKIGGWFEKKLAQLGDLGASILASIEAFLGRRGAGDLLNPGRVFEEAKAIFTSPVAKVKIFITGLGADILAFIKDAILRPLGALAAKASWWKLLCGVLGEDPVTGDAVTERAEAVLFGLLELADQKDIADRMRETKAIPRVVAWFDTTIGQLKKFVARVPKDFVKALEALDVSSILKLPTALAGVAGVLGAFVKDFVTWSLDAGWKLLEIIFDVVSPGALGYIKKTGAALKSILKNPLPFMGNLVDAGKSGFSGFAKNFGAHLKAGLLGWLTGSLQGVYIPKAFSLSELVKFVFSVLGLSWATLRQKLVKAIGETAVKALEVGFDVVVTLVRDGPAAAWERIKEHLSDLQSAVIGGITTMVVEAVVTKAVPKLVAMFIPGAGFISAILTIYDTVMVFVNKIRQIVEVVTGFVDSIVSIAQGNIAAAAARVERSLAGVLSLAINFLAGFAGLGKIATRVNGVIEKIRAKVDAALDKLVEWIVGMARRLGKAVAQAGVPQDPKERLRLAGQAAVAAARRLRGAVTRHLLEPLLAAIKLRYGLVELALFERNGTWWVRARVNPDHEENLNTPAPPAKTDDPKGTKDAPIPLEWVKPEYSQYPKITIPGIPVKGDANADGASTAATSTVAEPDKKTDVGELTLGVTNPVAKELKDGHVFEAREKQTGTSQVSKVNAVLRAHGYNREVGVDAPRDTDHIWEKQLGGPDEVGNLWPLNASTNRSSGSRVRAQVDKIKQDLGRSTLAGVWLRIVKV